MLSLISEQKTLSSNHNNTQKLANKVSKVTFKKDESVLIPDATAIYAARKAREEKKRIASIDDFISLNANGDEEVDEERPCGDEDDEEDEEFEDAYKGSKIGFGLNSILDEEIQRKKEFSESFMEMYLNLIFSYNLKFTLVKERRKRIQIQMSQWLKYRIQNSAIGRPIR